MKNLLSLKCVAGVVSSIAITGTLFAGFSRATTQLPAQWPISLSSARPSVEVMLVNESASNYQCDWDFSIPEQRLAKCPQVLVSAKRPAAAHIIADRNR
jgi:hypothetical protein